MHLIVISKILRGNLPYPITTIPVYTTTSKSPRSTGIPVTSNTQNFHPMSQTNPQLSSTTYTGNQLRILELLGSGLGAEVVATACGVSPSYVSQLLSEQAFSEQVTARRFANLQAATKRDASYDEIEDALIAKMQDLLPMMYKPMEVLRAITVINSAKRRGAGAPEHTHVNNTVVNLTIPTQILQKFVTNANNQVVEVGDQTLVTMPSAQLLNQLKQQKVLAHDSSETSLTTEPTST